MNIPVLTSTRKYSWEESPNTVSIFVKPLIEVLHSDPIYSETRMFTQVELLGFDRILLLLFDCMYNNKVIDDYNFSKDFAKLITKPMLRTIFNNGLDYQLFSSYKIINYYKIDNFIKHKNFDNIDYDLLDQFSSNLVFSNKTKELIEEYKDFINSNLDLSNIPETLDKGTYAQFDRRIRHRVADRFGSKYVHLEL